MPVKKEESEPDLFNEAEEARNEALERVLRNAGERWTGPAMRAIASVHQGWTGTGEDLRLLLIPRYLESPPDIHAWGAIVNKAIRKRFLMVTGERTPMRTKRSHARKTDIYVRTARFVG